MTTKHILEGVHRERVRGLRAALRESCCPWIEPFDGPVDLDEWIDPLPDVIVGAEPPPGSEKGTGAGE